MASVALNDAVRRELIAASPATHARAPKGPRVEPDPPTPDEVARLLEVAEVEDRELFVFLAVAANTGARRGELCALRWCDINFEAVFAAVDLSFDDRSVVWGQDPEATRPIYPDTISVRFRRLSRRHGLEHVQLRQLRHYAATQLLSAGVDVRTVAGRLRHSRPATTLDRYAAFLPARDREAAELLDAIGQTE